MSNQTKLVTVMFQNTMKKIWLESIQRQSFGAENPIQTLQEPVQNGVKVNYMTSEN